MTALRTTAVWTSIVLIGLTSAACWVGALYALLLWPLQGIAIGTLAVVVSLAAVRIAQVRTEVFIANHLAVRVAAAQPAPAPVPIAVAGVDDLRAVLGDELFNELSALDAPAGPAGT